MGVPKNPKVCAKCGNEFMPRSGIAKYCDDCKQFKRDESGKTVRVKKTKAKSKVRSPRAGQRPTISGLKSQEQDAHDRARGRRKKQAEEVKAGIRMKIEERVQRRIPRMANIKDGEEPEDGPA